MMYAFIMSVKATIRFPFEVTTLSSSYTCDWFFNAEAIQIKLDLLIVLSIAMCMKFADARFALIVISSQLLI